MCHVYVRRDNLSGVVISDHEYPQRVGFTLINKVRHCILVKSNGRGFSGRVSRLVLDDKSI